MNIGKNIEQGTSNDEVSSMLDIDIFMLGHFKFAKGMSLMIPDTIPLKITLVYITGIFEIVAAICLLVTASNVITGWLLIAFFILIVPANIYAAIKHVDF